MDDFAQKMAGPMGIRNNPTVGSVIRQGDKGWSLQDGEKSVDMLSPVSGEVTEVNTTLLAEMKKIPTQLKHWATTPMATAGYSRSGPIILSGRERTAERTLARKWMAEEVELLRSKMSPELGAVMQGRRCTHARYGKKYQCRGMGCTSEGIFMT